MFTRIVGTFVCLAQLTLVMADCVKDQQELGDLPFVLALVIPLALSVLTAASTGLLVFMILFKEGKKLQQVEANAFAVMDAVLVALLPKSLLEKVGCKADDVDKND